MLQSTYMYMNAFRSWASIFIILALLLVPLAFLAPSVTFAQEDTLEGIPDQIVPACGGSGEPECGLCHLAQLAQNVINFLLVFAVVSAAFLFAWAGGMLLVARDNANLVTRARSIFTSVLIGLIIILVAWLIVHTIIVELTGNDFTDWNVVCGDGLGS